MSWLRSSNLISNLQQFSKCSVGPENEKIHRLGQTIENQLRLLQDQLDTDLENHMIDGSEYNDRLELLGTYRREFMELRFGFEQKGFKEDILLDDRDHVEIKMEEFELGFKDDETMKTQIEIPMDSTIGSTEETMERRKGMFIKFFSFVFVGTAAIFALLILLWVL